MFVVVHSKTESGGYVDKTQVHKILSRIPGYKPGPVCETATAKAEPPKEAAEVIEVIELKAIALRLAPSIGDVIKLRIGKVRCLCFLF
jgi:uncharacterized protein (DUF169 family)